VVHSTRTFVVSIFFSSTSFSQIDSLRAPASTFPASTHFAVTSCAPEKATLARSLSGSMPALRRW
jgi:hypothetical protein